MNHHITEISTDTIIRLRNEISLAENAGELTPIQLGEIYKSRWFHLFVPKEYDGLDLSLPQAVRLEENISFIDGSLGWVVTLCAGAAMFIGYFDESLARSIFNDAKVCLAGSGKPNGIAKPIDDGYEITGTWPYASGAAHATHFTANCVIENTGQTQAFIFNREDVKIYRDWNYIGLNATSGFSFSVKNLKVPKERAFNIDPHYSRISGPVYSFPFLQFAEATIAATMSGMCMYFFDLAENIISNKKFGHGEPDSKRNHALTLVNNGKLKINLLREKFYVDLDSSWAKHVAGTTLSATELNAVSSSSLELAQEARALVNILYPYCGMEAARTNSIINQVWRNINTASQHTLLT